MLVIAYDLLSDRHDYIHIGARYFYQRERSRVSRRL